MRKHRNFRNSVKKIFNLAGVVLFAANVLWFIYTLGLAWYYDIWDTADLLAAWYMLLPMLGFMAYVLWGHFLPKEGFITLDLNKRR